MKAHMTLLVALAGLASASEQAPHASREVSIPYIGHESINDWQPDRKQGLWIQDEHHRWYYARLKEPCSGLENAVTIAFDTRPGGPFDRFSSIIVPHEERCHLQSLVRSEAPPRKIRRAPAKEKA